MCMLSTFLLCIALYWCIRRKILIEGMVAGHLRRVVRTTPPPHFSKNGLEILCKPRTTRPASVCKKCTFSPHWPKTRHTLPTFQIRKIFRQGVDIVLVVGDYLGVVNEQVDAQAKCLKCWSDAGLLKNSDSIHQAGDRHRPPQLNTLFKSEVVIRMPSQGIDILTVY